MGWFSVNTTKVVNVNEADSLKMDDHLKNMIDEWVMVELGTTGVKPNSKMMELLLCNLKLIYHPTEKGDLMRRFLFEESDQVEFKDYLISRIHDLYLRIVLTYPRQFVEAKSDDFEDALLALGYAVDHEVAKTLDYAWLLSMIQYSVRYFFNKKV